MYETSIRNRVTNRIEIAEARCPRYWLGKQRLPSKKHGRKIPGRMRQRRSGTESADSGRRRQACFEQLSSEACVGVQFSKISPAAKSLRSRLLHARSAHLPLTRHFGTSLPSSVYFIAMSLRLSRSTPACRSPFASSRQARR